MNPERFTEAALQAFAAAQQTAQSNHQQTLTVAHVLRALLDNDTAARAMTSAGGDLSDIRAALDAELAKLPRVQGGGDNLYLDPALGRALQGAEKEAQALGDAFIAADTLLLALRGESRTAAARRGRRPGRRGWTTSGATSSPAPRPAGTGSGCTSRMART